MKKHAKKLILHRETLYRIGTPWLAAIRGAVRIADSGEDTCGLCDSIASCSELAEDCCVTTRF